MQVIRSELDRNGPGTKDQVRTKDLGRTENQGPRTKDQYYFDLKARACSRTIWTRSPIARLTSIRCRPQSARI